MSGEPFEKLHAEKEAACYAAYTKEREVKARLMQAKERQQKADVTKLLQCVVEGEQDQAEALLRSYPYLGWQKGAVVDLSERAFENITAFQYAVWVLDSHMWQMLLRYLPKQKAIEQWIQFEQDGITYWMKGKNGERKAMVGKLGECLWDKLIQSLNILAQNWGLWNEDQIHRYWCEVIGEQQYWLPVHVVNEYCHPHRSFVPCPDFKETCLVRTRVTAQGEDWFQGNYLSKQVGEGTFAWQRGKWAAVQARPCPSIMPQIVARPYYRPHSLTAKIIGFFYVDDTSCEGVIREEMACQRLAKMRQLQLANLKDELKKLMVISERLKDHLLSELASLILEYFSEELSTSQLLKHD